MSRLCCLPTSPALTAESCLSARSVVVLSRLCSDLPTQVDVVVTELVDSGLLGEHILPVLRHARAHLLKPGGRVIPWKGQSEPRLGSAQRQ